MVNILVTAPYYHVSSLDRERSSSEPHGERKSKIMQINGKKEERLGCLGFHPCSSQLRCSPPSVLLVYCDPKEK